MLRNSSIRLTQLEAIKVDMYTHAKDIVEYCGPGTKLAKRLARGDPGVNPLDTDSKKHDISYSKNRENIEVRNSSDRVLVDKAWQRVFSRDASIGERVAAVAITNVMNVKSKLGMRLKKNRKAISKKKKRKI